MTTSTLIWLSFSRVLQQKKLLDKNIFEFCQGFQPKALGWNPWQKLLVYFHLWYLSNHHLFCLWASSCDQVSCWLSHKQGTSGQRVLKSLPLSYSLAWLSPFFWVQLPPVPSATTYRESFKTPEFKLLKMRSERITRTKRRLTNLSKTPFSNNLKKQEVAWLCPVKNKWWKKFHFLGALVNFISFLAGYNLNIQQDISAEIRSSKNFEECKSPTYFWLYESPRSILLRSLAFVPKTITFDINNHFIFAT